MALIKTSLFLFLLIILFACNNADNKIENLNLTKTFLKFNDADTFRIDWSKENKLIVHSISEPDNLHPTNGNSTPRLEVLLYTQRTLLNIDYEKQKIVPGIVRTLPEVSSDGLRFSYKLRSNITWDDNSPLTSEDIVFTAKAFKCPLTNDPSVRLYWENVENIITDDSDQLSFTIVMKKRHMTNISFLTGFSIMQRVKMDPQNILSHYSLNQFGDILFHAGEHPDLIKWANEFNDDKYGRNPEFMNGLGMYKVTEWASGQYITLTKKKNHWTNQSTDYHEKSYPETIIYKITKDESAQLFEFKSQKIDVSTNLSSSAFLRLNTDNSIIQNYNMAMLPTYSFTYVCINEKPDSSKRKKLFTDTNVRHALRLITPVDKLIKLIYGPYSSSCKRMTANVSPLKTDYNHNLEQIKFDLPAAEALLKKAGWIDSDNNGIVDKTIDGVKTDFIADLNYLSSSSDWRDMATVIAEEYAKAGIKIIPVGMDLKLFIEKAKAHDFDLILGSWGGSGQAEDYSQLFHTSSWTNHGSNYPGFGDKSTDGLIDSINNEINDSLHILLSHKLQQKIFDDCPYVFLYSSMRRNIIHKRFGNQMIFADRPGILNNMLHLLSINKGITISDEVSP